MSNIDNLVEFEKVNNILVSFMNRKQKLKYAVFATELILPLFEKIYPKNKKPREAIEATKRCIERDVKKNRGIASYCAYRIEFDSYSDYIANSVNTAIYYTAYASGCQFTCESATICAINTASDIVNKKTKLKILKYGLSLLKI